MIQSTINIIAGCDSPTGIAPVTSEQGVLIVATSTCRFPLPLSVQDGQWIVPASQGAKVPNGGHNYTLRQGNTAVARGQLVCT